MNNLSLEDFALFVQIAAAQSLSTVARERNVAASYVSRALGRIEAECGLRLVRRTTQSLSLTDEGEVFLEHAQRILGERNLLQDSLGRRSGSVRGTVRISVSQLLAEYVLIPQLAQFVELHPHLHLDLHIADRMVNMANEGIDIVIRAGIPPAGTLIARNLGNHGRALYAAPGYLKKHGIPRKPEDLKAHSLITNAATASHNRWDFLVDGNQATLTMQGSLRVNSSAAVLSLALAEAGIARINDVLGHSFVRQGKLSAVLTSYVAPGKYPICAAILAERHRAPKIRATLDYMQKCFAAFSSELD